MFKRGDVDDLERMLRLLISDPQVREEATRSARKRIRARYLWPQVTGEIESAYLKLMDWKELAGAERLDPTTLVSEKKSRSRADAS